MPANRRLRHDVTASATLVFKDNQGRPAVYPSLHNINAEAFAMVAEGYVFGNTRANHNHAEVVRRMAAAFGVQAHWD